MADGGVVAVVDAKGIVFGMSRGLEGGDEELVFLGPAQHVVLGVDCENRRQSLADVESRGGFVAGDGVARLPALFADRVVGEHLGAHLGDAGDGAEGQTVGFQAIRIHADEQGKGGPGGMTADEDLMRIAAVFGDMLHRPGEGGRGVVDVGGVFRLGAQAVVWRDDRDASLGQAFADLRAIFRTQVLAAVLHTAAVEPNVGRETLRTDGYGQVEFAAFLFVGSQRDDVVLVGHVLDDLRLDRPGRGGDEAQQQGERAHQAISCRTILPWTSVRR